MTAQAARLSLRMQKELKLLISDPPFGACFPLLSDHSDPITLTSILAQMKGPEGTVYEHGVFELDIRIPERYPFQPPTVTFSTPIYHPNIDTGGRICLDILNLPPKGAWQPSLNISTVLMSIGLLLSEPNPDDGLMCEASREYKYNRQAFDQKARSMIEKYAHPQAIRDNSATGGSSSNSIPSTLGSKSTRNESKPEPSKSVLNSNTIRGTSRKLTLGSSRPSSEMEENKASQLLGSDSVNQKKIEQAQKELKRTAEMSSQSQENLYANRRKLSLKAPQSHERNAIDVASLGLLNMSQTESDCLPKDLSLRQETISVDGCENAKRKKTCLTFPKRSLGSVRIDVSEEIGNLNPQLSPDETKASAVSDQSYHKPLEQKSCTDKIEYTSLGTSWEKLSLGRNKLSLGLTGSSGIKYKENVEPVFKSQSSKLKASEDSYIQKHSCFESLSNPSNPVPWQHENVSAKKLVSDQNRSETTSGEIRKWESEETLVQDSVIVLDSEDSGEENKSVSLRSKPSLTRKRLGKWKLRS